MHLSNVRSVKQIQIANSYSILDLIDQETADRLYDQGTNPSSSNLQAIRLPDFRVNIPLEPTFGKTRVPCLKVKPKTGNAKKIWEALLWTAIYSSKSFRIKHWYLLYYLFEKQISKDPASLALLRILRISTERSGKSLDQKLRSVRTMILNVHDRELAQRYCAKLESDLGVKLPTEDPHLDKLLEFQTGILIQKKPKAPARIGVGYKDKGTLPKGPKEDPECSEDYSVHVGNLFADLLDLTNETSILTNAYDPKKHIQLLNKLKNEL